MVDTVQQVRLLLALGLPKCLYNFFKLKVTKLLHFQFGDGGGGGLSEFNVSKHMFGISNSEFGDLSILNGI